MLNEKEALIAEVIQEVLDTKIEFNSIKKITEIYNLDSYNFYRLITSLEDRFSVRIDESMYNVEYFSSISKIEEVINNIKFTK